MSTTQDARPFPTPAHGESATLATLRGFLLMIFILGVLGAGAELLLLDHTEDFKQWIPLALMSLSLVVLGRRAIDRGPTSTRVFQAIMLLFVISGFAGLFLHYQGNVEFELEMYPSLKGLELFKKAIQGTTPPTLAPGTMIMLGLIGLAYTYRHPVFSKSAGKISNHNGERQ
ncbi:MAG: hypothetical protein ONB46_16830 [candidate division KSB1 bacterium]|nr:hypothetical protein [candidate division KSB1 bacterium]MDZ7367343.1 hypothetical protein [candidate division KSB1 bacterium]MDZ7405224.1 hypothetical protein [candidate division KSB1 bacterium]